MEVFFQHDVHLRQDPLQEEEKAKGKDKQSSSHLSTLLENISDEEEPIGIQAPRLEFPLHLPSRQPNQDSLSQVFVCCVHRMALVACRPIFKCGNLVVPGLVHSLWWNVGTKLGGSQSHAEPVGRLSRARTSLCQTSYPSKVIRRRMETAVEMSLPPHLDAAETPHLPCLDGQGWFPGVTHRAIQRKCITT